MIKKSYWTAVAPSKALKSKPIGAQFQGCPIVLFRDGIKIAALHDRCPHRHVQLSKGCIKKGSIECPYHGWRFDGDGKCVEIPGHIGKTPNYRVPVLRACERHGAIFVSNAQPNADPYCFNFQDEKVVSKLVTSSVKSNLVDAAENILDATHTHFTHKGLLRGLNSKRYKVDVELRRGEDWVEAIYTGEDRQEGLVSKFLEGTRVKTVGRFRAPGIAELEYWGPKGFELCTSFHLHQTQPNTVEGIGWLVGPHRGLFSYLKASLFKPFFHIALGQDRRVLASSFENAKRFDHPQRLVGPLDFLRLEIERIHNQLPIDPNEDFKTNFQIEL